MTAPSPELLHVAALMREALHTCILPWFGKLTADQIGEKGPEDFVTIADTSAEKFLGEALTKFRPGSRIIGEEGVAENPALLSTLADGECWIVDPVDGTLLFKNGKPHFGTLISRSQDGVTQAGWILETFLDKAGKLDHRIIIGDRESGVWLSPGAGKEFEPIIAFSGRTVSGKLTGNIAPECYKPGFLRDDLADRRAAQTTAIAWSDALYSSTSIYSLMLRGGYAASFEGFSNPWDHSAGTFLVQLLGGVSRHLIDGKDYHPDRFGTGVAVAIDQEVYATALTDAFRPMAEWPEGDPDSRKN